MIKAKSALISCIVLLFIMSIGFISLGINIYKSSQEISLLEEELNNNQTILSSTIDELNIRTQELDAVNGELIEANKNLQLSLNNEERLNNAITHNNELLEIANTTISDLKNEEYELVYMGDFKYTYYCDERYEHICGYGLGLTASGKPTEVGWTVAADTSVLPMGSIIYIEGIGFREVMDRGGGVNGNHIDILMATHNECYYQDLVRGGVWVLIKKT